MTDLGLINCLKGIWSLSIHKIVFHKSTIHLFSTKLHIFFSRNKKKAHTDSTDSTKKSTSFIGEIGLLWVCFGSVMGPLGSVMGLMGAETPI